MINWVKSYTPSLLGAHDVHVWVTPLRRDASDAWLRTLLSLYLLVPARHLVLEKGPRGKPYLKDHSLEFNFSYSHCVATMAVARQPIGVDVEPISRTVDYLAIAKRFFSPEEYHQLAAINPLEQVSAFFCLWTRKEAFVKAKGLGLSFGLDQFVVDLERDSSRGLITVHGDSRTAARWKLPVFLYKEYCVALAVEDPLAQIACFEWNGEVPSSK
ncbi:MAG TPA: 4'-phosphopantetheinyl transferase superfamily protein [Coxiellaceae bacterium]|nr:4'-phosphopantetheinyl transferase superfamily protein [Coxiellaceae bacterium]